MKPSQGYGAVAQPSPSSPASHPAQAASGGLGQAARPVRYSSAELLGSAVEVEIEHQTQVYRLRRTNQGKLILTK